MAWNYYIPTSLCSLPREAGSNSFLLSILQNSANLHSMDLSLTSKVDFVVDETLSKFTQLRSLNLQRNLVIGDLGVYQLSNLHFLFLCGNICITDQSLSRLTLLEKLCVSSSRHITSESISALTQLTSLGISKSKVHMAEIEPLSRLQSLAFHENLGGFNAESVHRLSSTLTFLNAGHHKFDYSPLTNLQSLVVRFPITPDAVSDLINLTSLSALTFSPPPLPILPRLKKLRVSSIVPNMEADMLTFLQTHPNLSNFRCDASDSFLHLLLGKSIGRARFRLGNGKVMCIKRGKQVNCDSFH